MKGEKNYGIEIGDRYGHLTILDNKLRTGKNNLSACLCQCDCGNTAIIPTADIKRGHSKSCGCRNGFLKIPHDSVKGESGSRLYLSWKSMIERCEVPSHKNYKDYGGRGITVCDEWRNDFQKFKKWAVGNGYSDNLTIDRIDTNGNYEPSNCRWSTWKEQQNNRRNNKVITYNGKTQTMTEWAEELNIHPHTLESRLWKGWSVERALNEPVHYKKRRCNYV